MPNNNSDAYKRFVLDLMTGDLDDDLDRVETLVKERRVLNLDDDVEDEGSDWTADANFQRGDRVAFNDTTSPKYLVGIHGTIIQKRRTKYLVHVDDDPRARQRANKRTVCPPSILRKATS